MNEPDGNADRTRYRDIEFMGGPDDGHKEFAAHAGDLTFQCPGGGRPLSTGRQIA
jgi:hypothetical protein